MLYETIVIVVDIAYDCQNCQKSKNVNDKIAVDTACLFVKTR